MESKCCERAETNLSEKRQNLRHTIPLLHKSKHVYTLKKKHYKIDLHNMLLTPYLSNRASMWECTIFKWIPNTKLEIPNSKWYQYPFKFWDTQLSLKEVGKYPIATNPYLGL